MKILSKNSLIIALAAFFAIGFAGSTALAAGPATVNLGSAGNFRILGKTAVTTTGSTSVNGAIGLSPAAASFITGFGLTMDPTNRFSTSALVVGNIYAADYAPPTPAVMTTAISDMEAAYVDAAGRALPTQTNVAAGLIGGQTFTPGLYKWTTDVSIPASAATTTDVTLSGSASDVWIFQIDGNLNVASGGNIASGAKIILTGGAQASNVFWQVAGGTGATIGTSATFKGNILTLKQIIIQTSAVLEGRALAQTQVTLDANTITGPGGSVPAAVESGSPKTGGITVVKTVINDNGGTKKVSDFPLFINGTPVVSGVNNIFATPATYTITEANDPNYTRTFSGDCFTDGRLTLNTNDSRVCLITNDDIGAAAVLPPVPPLIDVVKVPSPLALPAGPGAVTYTYTVSNIGLVPVTNITLVGDTCSPIVLASGDTNNDGKLDVNEKWVYQCSTTLSQTHTNTVVTTGWANGLSAVDITSATVVVGAQIQPPLIHITKIPSPLALRAGGGVVTYTEMVTNPGTVALSNVKVTDDKCAATTYLSGDTNHDAKLDVAETWTYTCQSKLTKNTTNIAQATGDANGLTARDLAIATVLVAAPSLPNTGYEPTTATSTKGLTRAAAIAAFHRSLGIGAKGKDVEALQDALEGKGFLKMPEGVAKGYFGNLTRKAIMEYQKSVSLPNVGVFGPKTREKLTSELGE